MRNWIALFLTISLVCGTLLNPRESALAQGVEPDVFSEDNESVRRSPYRESVTSNDKDEIENEKEKNERRFSKGKKGADEDVTEIRTEDNDSPKRKKNYSIAELEKRLFELINEDRAKAGRAPVELNKTLCKLAKSHAEDMAKKDFFNHVGSDGADPQTRAKRFGIASGVYENIGKRYGDETAMQMVEKLQEEFMSEPDVPGNHRSNILQPLLCCAGVAVAKTKDGIVLVEEFTETEPPESK